jgi:hypothetical protein
MTFLAIVVVGKFQVEFLLVLGQLLLALDRRFIMTLHAFLNLIPLFPNVFTVLVYVMALVASDLVIPGVFFVGEFYWAFCMALPPKRRLNHKLIGHLLIRCATQTQENYAGREHHYR